MSKKARSQAIQVRKRRKEKDLAKAEKRRQLEQVNAAARRLKLIELLRTKAKVVQSRQATADRNLSCPCPDEPDPPKQEICCSRMFGRRLAELAPIKEAVAMYVMRASEKLRAQGSVCKKIRVSIRTGMFNPEEAKYANGVIVDLPYPTDYVRVLTKAAVDALDSVYRPGFKYSKAEILLLNLYRPGQYTDDLFAVSQPLEATKLMVCWTRSTIDGVGERYARPACLQIPIGLCDAR
jgi:DNA polymerase V